MKQKNLILVGTGLWAFFSGMFFSEILGMDRWEFYFSGFILILFWYLGFKYGKEVEN